MDIPPFFILSSSSPSFSSSFSVSRSSGTDGNEGGEGERNGREEMVSAVFLLGVVIVDEGDGETIFSKGGIGLSSAVDFDSDKGDGDVEAEASAREFISRRTRFVSSS